MTAPMIPTPGDYRTAGGQRAVIIRIGKWAVAQNKDKWDPQTGKHRHNPIWNITGPWVAEPAPKPLELWVNMGGPLASIAYDTKAAALGSIAVTRTRVAVHMIEASELARVQAERDEAVALLRGWYGSFNEWVVSRNALLAKIGSSK